MPFQLKNYPVIRFPLIPSTNSVAFELAAQGGSHGTVVLAAAQKHGRGRGKKSFFSPPGGLYMSVILRPELKPERLPLITLAAGIACASAIDEFVGLTVALKWPNDLYLHGRKLGGILAETGPYSSVTHAIPFVVLGIGINVNTRQASFAPELQNIATSLYDVLPGHYDLDELLAIIHSHVCAQVVALCENSAEVVNSWRQRDYLLGKAINWRDGRGKLMQGRGAGIRADGCYQLQTPDGTMHTILAGEVSIGPIGE